MVLKIHRAAIFSDLHLPNVINKDYKLFLTTLHKLLANDSIKEFWFVGDVFDCLVGNNSHWEKLHSKFWDFCNAASSKGRKIIYLEGNHDFNFKKIAHKYGVQLHKEGRCHLFQGRRVFLSHGDELDTNIEAYRKWRKFTKSEIARKAYNAMPNFMLKKLMIPFAENYSSARKKKSHIDTTPNENIWYKNKFRSYAEELLRDKGYHAVVLGHSHIKALDIFGSTSFYLNLGSWLGEEKPYAIWSPEEFNDPQFYEAKG